MEVVAKIKYLRMSPKKIRLVADVVRGMDVGKAEDQLRFINKAATRPLEKLLKAALANAEHNFQLVDKNNLYIKKIEINEGPTLKRWRARAFGRAGSIRKRSSHLRLVLGERVEQNKSKTVLPDKKVSKEEIKIVKSLKDLPREKPAVKSVGEEVPEKEKITKDLVREKKEEPFDATRRGKHRLGEHLETKKSKGFLKKIFNRKAV